MGSIIRKVVECRGGHWSQSVVTTITNVTLVSTVNGAERAPLDKRSTAGMVHPSEKMQHGLYLSQGENGLRKLPIRGTAFCDLQVQADALAVNQNGADVD
jgi:hypothetical protein